MSEHSHSHSHSHSANARFHDPAHAAEFDRTAAVSDIRGKLAERLIEAMALRGDETVLDVATGTGRFARPVSGHLAGGSVVGIDPALAMLRVSRNSDADPIARYGRVAATAERMPLREGIFDCAWVAFSLHHFASATEMVREAGRVLKPGGRLFILDPIIAAADDALDAAVNSLINEVFQRSHGAGFRFFAQEEIRRLMTDGGMEVVRDDLHTYPVDQDGTDGIPTGRHWIEVMDELEQRSPELKARFQERYFRYEKTGERVHLSGGFHFGLVAGEKRRGVCN